MAGRRAAFGFIFASAVASAVALSIIIPILPAMVRQLEGGDPARAAEWMVLFATTFGVAQFLCAPVLGMLSDRFGRRPVLLIASLGLSADYLFMAFAPTVEWLLVGRVIGGMTAATFAAANAYVADVTPPEERSKAFGWMSSALAFGFLSGPVLGGFLGEINTRLPFLDERLLQWRDGVPLRTAAMTLPTNLEGLFYIGLGAPRGPQWPVYCEQTRLVMRFLTLRERGMQGLAAKFAQLQPADSRIDIVKREWLSNYQDTQRQLDVLELALQPGTPLPQYA